MRAGADAAAPTHLFFDVGGVLGTDGWDRRERAAAVKRFDLDARQFQRRHRTTAEALETGVITLDEYLDATVFYAPRPFSRAAFKAFMREQSRPYPDSIALARALARAHGYRLMTLNNEAAELNIHRLKRFGLLDIFAAFFTSCWLGVAKPARRIYEIALDVAQADPARTVFVDDRAENLAPARALGMHTVRYTGAARLAKQLAALGVRLSPKGVT